MTYTINQLKTAASELKTRLVQEGVNPSNLDGIQFDSLVTDLVSSLASTDQGLLNNDTRPQKGGFCRDPFDIEVITANIVQDAVTSLYNRDEKIALLSRGRINNVIQDVAYLSFSLAIKQFQDFASALSLPYEHARYPSLFKFVVGFRE